MIVGFPGNQFKGDIVPALAELVESGTIRIIDLAFVLKDKDGNVTAMEIEDLEGGAADAFQALQAVVGDLVNEEDLEAVGEALDPNSSAMMLVWEDVWATKVKEAIRGAGGVLLDLERVPADFVDAALAASSTKLVK
jgi:uncharacterized membrane protein